MTDIKNQIDMVTKLLQNTTDDTIHASVKDYIDASIDSSIDFSIDRVLRES